MTNFYQRPSYLLAAALVCCTPLAAQAGTRAKAAKKKTPVRVVSASAAQKAANARRNAAHQASIDAALFQAAKLRPVVTLRSAQIVDMADESDAALPLLALPPAPAPLFVQVAPLAPSASLAQVGPPAPPANAPGGVAASGAAPAATGVAGTEGDVSVATPADEDDNAPGPPGPPGPPAAGGIPGTLDEDANAVGVPGVPGAGGIPSGGDSDLSAPATRTTDSFVEIGGSGQSLTNGFGSWSSVYLRTQYRLNEKNTFSAEATREREFGDSGTFVGLGLTHIFNDDWFGSVALGTSSGGFFLPRLRGDVFINRKLLRNKNLVATLGLGFFNARDVYTDRSVYLGASYYFAPRWIAEGGIRFNNSNPGSVGSTSQFAALTYGQEKKRFITARIGNGRESYQLIGPGLDIVDFASNEASLTIRQWLGGERGVNLVLERYKNPSYSRRGVSLGFFQDF